jgi:hypothetical protein
MPGILMPKPKWLEATVTLHWRELKPGDEMFEWSGCLYALFHPVADTLLYIGMAGCSTVRQRLLCPSKDRMWQYIEREHGVAICRTFVAYVELKKNKRLSLPLLRSIEGQLIQALDPCANIQGTQSRRSRPGLCVRCKGDWLVPAQYFFDNDGSFAE